MTISKLTVEQFLKSRLRDRTRMRKAAEAIDAFRKRYGRRQSGFDSVKALRKIREGR